MEYTFSNKISALQPSAIREILKATADPAIIPLAAGNPAPDAFPVDEVRAITADILQKTPIDALQYGVSEGYQPLRDTVRDPNYGPGYQGAVQRGRHGDLRGTVLYRLAELLPLLRL